MVNGKEVTVTAPLSPLVSCHGLGLLGPVCDEGFQAACHDRSETTRGRIEMFREPEQTTMGLNLKAALKIATRVLGNLEYSNAADESCLMSC